MKRLLIASTALTLMMGPPLVAQDPTEPRGEPVSGQQHDRGHDDQAYTEDHPWVGLPVLDDQGERIGSVQKVRIGADAQSQTDGEGTALDQADLPVAAFIIETGGFLGVGGREVEVEPGQAELVEEDGDDQVQLDLSQDEIENMPEAETSEGDDGRSGRAGGDRGETASQDARSDDRGRQSRDQAADDEFGDSGDYSEAGGASDAEGQQRARDSRTSGDVFEDDEAGQQNRDEQSREVEGAVYTDGHHWVGTPVYTSDDERVGSVTMVKARGEAEIAGDGESVAMSEAEPDIAAVIVETGGFLGIGAREVEINPDNASRTLVDGEERLVLDMDETAFEALPEHEGPDSDDAGGQR